MTNGRGAGMASFMSKKKKYKFQVDVVIEDLLEVPFVSAVLFAKLRLLDGGSFQDHSTRQEVKDHAVKWGSKFSFPCKMFANASTCVLERCILRISVRKECKGGRSFTKLGFVDINLAEYAGAGEISKKALLEGYDARHRQDNSMLKFSIKMHMLSGDILFKVPSPAPKHKQIGNEDNNADTRTLDDFSSSSLGGSTASGSSGFGSLPKKRPQLLNSDLVKGPSLIENNVPITISTEESSAQINQDQQDEGHCEQGHSRNSSNTSQMSKASGYSSIHSHSHSRQSSSGDSGHIRKPIRITTTCYIPTTHPEVPSPLNTPEKLPHQKTFSPNGLNRSNLSTYATPKNYQSQLSQLSTDNSDDYRTPDDTLDSNWLENSFDLQKSFSLDPVKFEKMYNRKSDGDKTNLNDSGVLRSASEVQISRNRNVVKIENFVEKSDNLFSLLTPIQKRKKLSLHQQQQQNGVFHSTPKSGEFKVPKAPSPPRYPGLLQNNRTSSLNSLRFGNQTENWSCNGQGMKRNPSSSSLVLSETGSLDRAKAALEKRKKVGQSQEENVQTTGRVEETRVNPNHLIEELLKSTNLEPTDDSAENSGLQLFIAKDGTASLGNHEVKSQMSTGHHFKQVVMEDKR
ncbi:EEIG family member 2 isoform X2 [Onthophagus taurus]|uniref:EEIG family member 2 isoform X2 n=1 Tax=Onthophagus taurus TaxID=166361 RepID=UPI0039BEBB13